MADTTTVIGRSKLVHPDLGYTGGSALHTLQSNLFENLSDNLNSRYKEFAGILDSTTVELDHNFGVAFEELSISIFTGSGTNLTKVSSPLANGWTLNAKVGFLKTILEITTPSSGGPHTFAVQCVVGGSGSGSGQGKKNYILNPSAAVLETTYWTSSNFTVTRDTSTSIPRETTTKSAFKLVSTNTNATFTTDAMLLDDVDLNKKLGGEIAINVADASNWTIEVQASATSGGSYVALPLSTDVSSVTTLPATTGVFKFNFDTVASTPYIKFQIKSATTAKTAYFSDILLSPDSNTVSGTVITDWKSYSAINWASGVESSSSHYRRVGSNIEVTGQIELSGAAPSDLIISLPTGLTIDSTIMTGARADVGIWSYKDYDVSQRWRTADISSPYSGLHVRIISLASNTFYLAGNENVVNAGWPITWADGDQITFAFSVPIAEWKGKGVTNYLTSSVLYSNARGRFTLSTNKSIPADDSYHTIEFDTDDANYNQQLSVSATGEITIPADGVYSWHAQLRDASTPNYNDVAIYVDGSQITFSCIDAGNGVVQSVGSRWFNAGEVVTVRGIATGGGNITASSDAFSTFFEFKREADITSDGPLGFGEATNDAYGLVKSSSGTWTPAIADNGSGTATASGEAATSAKYIRLGNIVSFSYKVTWTSASGAGLLRFNVGLPINCTTNGDTVGNFSTTAGSVNVKSDGYVGPKNTSNMELFINVTSTDKGAVYVTGMYDLSK